VLPRTDMSNDGKRFPKGGHEPSTCGFQRFQKQAMRRLWAASLLCFALSAICVEAQEPQTWTECLNRSQRLPADTIIAACTAVISESNEGDRAIAFMFRGNAYQAKGDLDHAIADHSEAIRLDPNASPAFVARGTAY